MTTTTGNPAGMMIPLAGLYVNTSQRTGKPYSPATWAGRSW